MKQYKHLFISLLLISATLVSCESQHENAGDLAGMWQLTLWTGKNYEDTLSTKSDGIYYCVQRNLMKFQQTNSSCYYLSYYRHTPDSLIIYHAMNYPGDTLVTLKDLATYGVPDDGKFLIQALTSDRMVLESSHAVLQFRKY